MAGHVLLYNTLSVFCLLQVLEVKRSGEVLIYIQVSVRTGLA